MNEFNISGSIENTNKIVGFAATHRDVSGSIDSHAGTIDGSVDYQTQISGSAVLKRGINGSINIGSISVREIRFLPISEFPEVGKANLLYVDTTNDRQYYWDGAMYRSLSSSEMVVARTTAEWESTPEYLSKSGCIYVYTDYIDGVSPAIKIGDGKSYVVDLPFFSSNVTDEEREFWNNKVSAKLNDSNPEILILHTD